MEETEEQQPNIEFFTEAATEALPTWAKHVHYPNAAPLVSLPAGALSQQYKHLSTVTAVAARRNAVAGRQVKGCHLVPEAPPNPKMWPHRSGQLTHGQYETWTPT